jgi:hypothetical protein
MKKTLQAAFGRGDRGERTYRSLHKYLKGLFISPGRV